MTASFFLGGALALFVTARVPPCTLLHPFTALVNLADKNGLPTTSALMVSDLAVAGSRSYPGRSGPSLSVLGQVLG